MTGADEEMPRAKRLKLLRELKARKELGKAVVGDKSTDLSAAALKSSFEEPMEVKKDDPDGTHATREKADVLVHKVDQAQSEFVKTESDSDEELLNLAPKHANWDMERDIAPLLRKLERRTQHAVVELLREKLAADKDSDNEEEEEEEENEA
ncbi:hypothetical protein PsorP6_008402 [Peronosclerospora sorghi]|uniref:Uncharacterized protein n=1 Tax=Peronosclerospora sorghi TaxID=230839 RepID=A0ACC0WAY7_9STRA|nr:hypothetical protein PsorP6_008402 [Peronosclerospora sorghi]